MINSLTIGLHVLCAGIFVGANVFLDFLLTPRLELIPPGQAARLGDRLGVDFARLIWATLIGLPATGLLMLLRFGLWGDLVDYQFYLTGYGSALLFMIVIWLTVTVNGAILTFYLRPRVIVKLPYDATRQEIEDKRNAAPDAAAWMRRLARYNAIAGMVGVMVGGFLRFGGFFEGTLGSPW
ncbi:MAG: CopD family protein [Deltaproteobacteria bacterium]|nr:CopD family protein [Deltaproteobacteria bacterium]